MKFSRHARNGLRKLRMTTAQAEAIVAAPVAEEADPAGNRRCFGYNGEKVIRVVVAADGSDTIISVHERRRLPR